MNTFTMNFQLSDLCFYPTWLSRGVRCFSVVFFAALMTVTLFVVMQKLIFVKWIEPEDISNLVIPNIVMPDVKPIEPDYFKKIVPIETVEPPIEQLETEPADLSVEPVLSRVHVNKANVEIKIGNGSNDFPIAQYLINAQYPRTALQRGIEGYVDLRFDVNEQGQTKNISVLAAEPEGIFERAAVKAVSKWRYQPKTIDGVPQYFSGVTNRVRFQMNSN